MRILFRLLPIFVFTALPQLADARVCERFTTKDYASAKKRFIQLQKKLRLNTDKALAAALHEAIAQDEFYESRLEYLCDTLAPHASSDCFTSDIIDAPVGSSKLTALHVAAALERREALLWLLEKGANVNARDALRFSPAHFAAIQQNREVLDLLTQHGANMDIENAFGANVEQLWTLTHLMPNSEQRISLGTDDQGKISDINGDEFCELTGATFVESIKMRPLQVIEDWSKGPQSSPLPSKYNFNSRVKAFKPKAGSLYLRPITATDDNGKQMNLGLGLFAGRDFAQGEIVELYAAEWASNAGDAEYQLDNLDGSKLRGYLPISADGLPNVVSLPFFNAIGIASGAFVQATRPIAAGEAIMWDYGGHDIKWQLYKELGEEALNQKIEQQSISSRIALLDVEELNSNQDNESLLAYIANTPSVYVRLVAENRMSVSDFTKLRKHVKALRLSGPGMMQISDAHFSMLAKGMSGLSDPRIASFAARKAREGNVQILFMMLLNMNSILATESEPELEATWTQLHKVFCAQHDKLGRGACHLLKNPKDEL